MDLTEELFDNSPEGNDGRKQAVIICLQFPIGKLQEKKALNAVFELDAILRDVIETSKVGTYGGNEFAENDEGDSISFYLYGSDAGEIYSEIQPIFDTLSSLTGFYIIKRYSQFSENLYH